MSQVLSLVLKKVFDQHQGWHIKNIKQEKLPAVETVANLIAAI